MTNAEITKAILSINPNAEFVLRGDDLSGLEWLSEEEKPTDAVILAALESLPAKEMEKKAARDAILERLGITEDEAKLLIG
jgi:hypothetical protein